MSQFPTDVIGLWFLELLNIDPVDTRIKLERDLWTINDPTFNEMVRSIYNDAAQKLAENSDVIQIIADKLGLDYTEPEEGGGRF